MKKLSVIPVLKDSIGLGLKNFPSLLLATLLYIVTIWIPYLNVGTTIAMSTIPLELSKGKVINPVFIFESRFRRIMPEFFTLIGLMFVALVPAFLFMYVPGIILSLAWSQALLLLLDKGIAPTKALVESNKITYGNKLTIFLVGLCIGLAVGVISCITNLINETFGSIMTAICAILVVPITFASDAIIYKALTSEGEEVAVETEAPTVG